MTELKQRIGMAVRTARKGQKLTQEALADKADVSMETISNVERAETLPTVDILFKIARVVPLDLPNLAQSVPNADGALSKGRMRLETAMLETVQKLSDDKLKTLVEIAQVLARSV